MKTNESKFVPSAATIVPDTDTTCETLYIESLRTQLIKNHAIDIQNLQLVYGIDKNTMNPIRLFFDDDDLQFHQPVNDLHRSLLVYPIDQYGFEYWVIKGARPEIFDPHQESTIVYLHIIHYPGSIPTFNMADSIFWFADEMVIAHANIEEVHVDDIVVVADGLIVPVTATFAPRILTPLKIDDWTIEEHGEEYRNLLNGAQQKIDLSSHQYESINRAIPELATYLELSLGNAILNTLPY